MLHFTGDLFQKASANLNSQKKSVKPDRNRLPRISLTFTDNALKPLSKDTITISGEYVSEPEIAQSVEQFRDKLIQLSKKGKLKSADLNQCIQNLFPQIKVDVEDIKYSMFNDGRVAVCSTDYFEHPRSKLYIDFNISNDRIIQNATHEFTHLLQDNTLKNIAIASRAGRYGQVQEVFNAFRDFEMQFLKMNYMNDLAQRADEVCQQLNSSPEAEPLNALEFNDSKRCQLYDQYIEDLFQRMKFRNKDMALEIFARIAENERDAYIEGFKAKKKLAGIPEREYIIQDVLPKMYSDLVQYLKKSASSLK
jgi:hypothetical protein